MLSASFSAAVFDPNWIIAIFTVVLAISTIFLWISTHHAASASQRAASIAEQALVSLERPFVFVKEISLFIERGVGPMGAYGTNLPGAAVSYRISAIFENSGESPALRAAYNFNCGHVARSNIPEFGFPDQGPPRKAVIGPKATLTTFEQPISPAAMEEIARGVDRWFIWGWIDYDDVFEHTTRHRTEYCFEVSARRLPTGEMFIGFPMHDRFNATDGDCLRVPQPFEA